MQSCSSLPPRNEASLELCQPIRYGIHSTDVTQTSIILWAHLNATYARFVVTGADKKQAGEWERVDRSGVYIQKVSGLSADSLYEYEIQAYHCSWASSGNSKGKFRTLPPPTSIKPFHLLWGADIAGQDYCRTNSSGYDIFRSMMKKGAQLFIGAGDMIYADHACSGKNDHIPMPIDDPKSLIEFRAKYLYNFADPMYRRFLSQIPTIATWDDHELRDNFDSTHPLMDVGIRAFTESFPIFSGSPDWRRIYRRRQLGSVADLFVLDTRQYRSADLMKDGPKKTMLGEEQLEWLLQGLKNSRSVWKIVVCSVPIALPTGYPAEIVGRDGWANYFPAIKNNTPGYGTGFEFEFNKIFNTIKELDIRNVIFLTGDAHRAMATEFRDRSGDVIIREFMSGPLSAIPLSGDFLDKTFNPKLLYYRGDLMNYGGLKIHQDKIEVEFYDKKGETIWSRTFRPETIAGL